jgi:hypothetical protein
MVPYLSYTTVYDRQTKQGREERNAPRSEGAGFRLVNAGGDNTHGYDFVSGAGDVVGVSWVAIENHHHNLRPVVCGGKHNKCNKLVRWRPAS